MACSLQFLLFVLCRIVNSFIPEFNEYFKQSFCCFPAQEEGRVFCLPRDMISPKREGKKNKE